MRTIILFSAIIIAKTNNNQVFKEIHSLDRGLLVLLGLLIIAVVGDIVDFKKKVDK